MCASMIDDMCVLLNRYVGNTDQTMLRKSFHSKRSYTPLTTKAVAGNPKRQGHKETMTAVPSIWVHLQSMSIVWGLLTT